VLSLLTALAPALHAHADEFRPAYLQLMQVDAETWDVLWKVPAIDESTVLKLNPVFPEEAAPVEPIRSTYAMGTAVQRWRIHVPGGLAGQPIAFPGLAANRIDVLVRIVRSDGSEQLERVLPTYLTITVKGSPGTFEVVRTYTVLGVEHILSGVDHLLFVLALLILVKGTRRLIATITAFTLAHSLTLVAATLGWLHIPGPPVEASIALSIIFLAAEIIHVREGRVSLTAQRPSLIAFAFGLLHGLGFAGALAEVGLPQTSIPTALLCFNLGVEIGQLMFIGVVLALIASMRALAHRGGVSAPAWAWKGPPYLIGSIAGFWLIERIAGWGDVGWLRALITLIG
jgi:hydrogenase/urease accessory protein HupE